MKHIEAWIISICLYAVASAWGIASVLNEALLLRRLQKLPNVPVVSIRRLSVRLFIMLQSLTRLLWFLLGLADGGSLEQRHSLLSCILDVIAWAFQFSAIALITQYICDVLHVNETGASNYVRFESRRRKVYGTSTVAVLVTVITITVFAFVRAKDAYFVANCVSLCLCAAMSYLTLLLHRRVPAPKLVLLAGSCFFAFAVTVGNGVYIRASNGAFLPSAINDIIYPWFIYQVNSTGIVTCCRNSYILFDFLTIDTALISIFFAVLCHLRYLTCYQTWLS